jgi:streptogramin lyase
VFIRVHPWLLFVCAAAFAQRPTNPALLIPQSAPDLGYAVTENPLTLPAGTTMGPPASVAFDSRGHIFVLNRGPQPLMEFDEHEKFIRAFGEGLFTRTHGLRIDPDGNLWVADVGAHIVVKMNREGQVLLTLGTKGQPGRVNEPNDIAIGRNGDVFIAQGHSAGKGEPGILKFDKNGTFIKSWVGSGSEPGKFLVAHGIAVDAKGLLWVADRENQRIQIFDQNGEYIRGLKYAGLPCSIQIGDQYIYMVNGFAGQLLRLDLDGKVLAAMGKPGKGPGEFGEAHFVTVSPKGEIFTADTVNSSLQRFVKK